jgi:hypothetical protein
MASAFYTSLINFGAKPLIAASITLNDIKKPSQAWEEKEKTSLAPLFQIQPRDLVAKTSGPHLLKLSTKALLRKIAKTPGCFDFSKLSAELQNNDKLGPKLAEKLAMKLCYGMFGFDAMCQLCSSAKVMTVPDNELPLLGGDSVHYKAYLAQAENILVVEQRSAWEHLEAKVQKQEDEQRESKALSFRLAKQIGSTVCHSSCVKIVANSWTAEDLEEICEEITRFVPNATITAAVQIEQVKSLAAHGVDAGDILLTFDCHAAAATTLGAMQGRVFDGKPLCFTAFDEQVFRDHVMPA